MVALIALLVSDAHAKRAEQHSRDAARRQETLDRERAIEIEIKERNRELARDRIRIGDFVNTVVLLIGQAVTAVDLGLALTSQGPVFLAPPLMVDSLSAVSGSLTALLVAAPMDPEIIVLTQYAATVSRMAALKGQVDCISANHHLNDAKQHLSRLRTELNDRAAALIDRLQPSPTDT